MDQLVVVAHPEPIPLEARRIEHDTTPSGAVALAYYYNGNMIARGVVAEEAIDAIQALLSTPISVALAATEDEHGNIEARVCLILPMDPEQLRREAEADDEDDEPWKASVPAPPTEIFDGGYATEEEPRGHHIALLPIGNVVRGYADRSYPEDIAGDVREMLENLLAGRAKDAVAKAIDDLLNSI